MRLIITKKDPHEFIMLGMDCLTAWKPNPRFHAGYAIADFWDTGESVYPHWEGIEVLTGENLRKILSQELKGDLWSALKFTYRLPPDDLYQDLSDYYDKPRMWHRYQRKGTRNHMEDYQFRSNRALDWYHDVTSQKWASRLVEKKGQEWWNWKYEIDVELSLPL